MKDSIPEPEREVYKKSIVTFIDILGFKEKVLSYRPDQTGNFVHLFKELAGKNRKSATDVMQAICFSDSIVRVTKINEGLGENALITSLVYEIEDLAHAQWAACEIGFFIRGGLCLKDIYISGNVVFGPGLIEAYRIESTEAKAPMIMISSQLDSILAGSASKKGQLMRDEKGRLFVNYLGVQSGIVSPEEFVKDICLHKAKVDRACNEWQNGGCKKYNFHSWLNWYQGQFS